MSPIPYAGRLPYASLALALVLVGCQPTALRPAAPSPSVSADGLYLPERDLGPLFQAVDPARSTWDVVDTALGSAELQVTLAKAAPMRWLMLTRDAPG